MRKNFVQHTAITLPFTGLPYQTIEECEKYQLWNIANCALKLVETALRNVTIWPGN